MFAVEANKLPLEEFEDVKNQMEQFSLRFNSLILEKKSLVLNSKQQHINKVNDLERQIQKLKSGIETGKSKREKTAQMISDTMEDLHTKQAKVDEMKQQLEELTALKEQLDGEIAALQTQVSRLEDLLKFSQTNLTEQLARDIGELTKYEMYLGLRIEAVDIDLLKFKFVNIDANDIDKEVTCELFVGEDKYRVLGTDPALPSEKVTPIENAFNEHGEFILFLRAMRTALRDAA